MSFKLFFILFLIILLVGCEQAMPTNSEGNIKGDNYLSRQGKCLNLCKNNNYPLAQYIINGGYQNSVCYCYNENKSLMNTYVM